MSAVVKFYVSNVGNNVVAYVVNGEVRHMARPASRKATLTIALAMANSANVSAERIDLKEASSLLSASKEG